MIPIDLLIEDVYTLTNRSDLMSETRLAVRKAIMKSHSADLFKRDLAVVTFAPTSYQHDREWLWNIQLSEFPRFRRPKYMRSQCKFFNETTADNIFDRYRYELTDYFYVAGSTLTLKTVVPYPLVEFGYYQYPDIPPYEGGDVDSWIATEYPDMIVEEAAGTVFKMIGKDDEYNRYAQLFAENLAILKGTDLGEGL